MLKKFWTNLIWSLFRKVSISHSLKQFGIHHTGIHSLNVFIFQFSKNVIRMNAKLKWDKIL